MPLLWDMNVVDQAFLSAALDPSQWTAALDAIADQTQRIGVAVLTHVRAESPRSGR